MNIQQYYQQSAFISLNGSIVSAGILSILLTASLLFSWNLPMLVVVVPFLTISIFQYYSYLLFNRRSIESIDSSHHYGDQELLCLNQLLITFYPAPALRLLFFTPDGMLAGELKEIEVKKWRWILPYFLDQKISKKFGLFDFKGNLQGQLIYDGKGIKMLNGQNEAVGFFYPKKASNGGQGIAVLAGARRLSILYSGLNQQIKFVDDKGMYISNLQNGWMPLEWTRFFKDANTPVLTFDYGLSTPARLAIIAALAYRYQYYNH